MSAWMMYASHHPSLADQYPEHPDGPFLHFGDDRTVRLYGGDPVAVEVVEDLDGPYYGWIEDPDYHFRLRGTSTPYRGEPVMIQPNRGLFAMQFTYGPEIEAEHGKGRIVRLSVRYAVIDAVHLAHQRDWSLATFGPGPRTRGVIDHIRKELGEIAADPTDLIEWVDVIILAFDGAWRAGWEPQEIIDAIKFKQARNEARSWPDWRTASPDHAIEHIKDPS